MKNNKPKIRFKDFTGPWEQRKVQNVADRFDNLRIPVAANLRVHGTTPYYGANGIQDYVDGFTHDGEFVLVAEDGANDLKNYPVKCVNGRIWVNNHAHVLQGKAGIADNSFLAFAISQSDIESLLVGGGRAKLNAETLMSIEFRLPCLQEQYQISEYLTLLDNLITLHQRKCDNLKKIKKAMLEKMFPKNGNSVPDVRFKGFTDDWEQRKLRDKVGIYDGVHQTPKYQDGGIMFLSVENIATLHSSKYISEEDFKRDYKVYPQENDILMTRIGDVGTTNVVTDNGLKAYYVSLALLKYRSTNPFFLSNAIQSDYVQNGLANRTLKTAIPMKINKDEIGKVDVMLPTSTDEQVQIGTYFRNLDNLITLHQRKVENLKKIKRAMLEKMFPKEDLI